MKAPYDKRTEDTRNRMMGDRNSYIPNRLYKSNEGEFYFYINSKGYYHVISLRKIKVLYTNEKFYEIVDSLLTKDNMIKEVNSYGNYETVEDAINKMKEYFAEG